MTNINYVEERDGELLVKASTLNHALSRYHEKYLNDKKITSFEFKPNLEPFFMISLSDDYWKDSSGNSSGGGGLICQSSENNIYGNWALKPVGSSGNIVLHPRPADYIKSGFGYTLLIEISEVENADNLAISISGTNTGEGQLVFNSILSKTLTLEDFTNGKAYIHLISRTAIDKLFNLTIAGLDSTTTFWIRLSLYESPYNSNLNDYEWYVGSFVPYYDYVSKTEIKNTLVTNNDIENLFSI